MTVRAFARFAKRRDAYEVLQRSVAPSLFGHNDAKKAIACLLFGGTRKVLPDGTRLRGDINVLLLGDPGTGKVCFVPHRLCFPNKNWRENIFSASLCVLKKSQLLKFVEKCAPIGVYTSGKGSSAAGLTASVVRDRSTREFYLEVNVVLLLFVCCCWWWWWCIGWRYGDGWWRRGEQSFLLSLLLLSVLVEWNKTFRHFLTCICWRCALMSLIRCICETVLLFMKQWNNKPFPLLKRVFSIFILLIFVYFETAFFFFCFEKSIERNYNYSQFKNVSVGCSKSSSWSLWYVFLCVFFFNVK